MKIINWKPPSLWAKLLHITETYFIFLNSSKRYSYSGRYSFIACFPKKHIRSQTWTEFETLINDVEKQDHPKTRFKNNWFGYLGYGLKDDLETLPKDEPGYITMPNLWMIQYGVVMQFDHEKESCEVFYEDKADFDRLIRLEKDPHNDSEKSENSQIVKSEHSNMSDEDYKQKVEDILEAIKQGDLYQANLTRKFYGDLHDDVDHFSLFETLSEVSPSPYGAYLKFDKTTVLSTSPEQFLQINPEGDVVSRPIKGTSPRFSDKEKDRVSFKNLENSEKDRSENLMIVDLMRHDFSRSCEPGSVKVSDLFKVDSFSHIHHMASKIAGKKKKELSTVELVKQAFPPGSMTGAPKIKAMEICTQLEKQERGIYSGAIGYFTGDGSVDLSVVIRTLIIQEKKYEFQVGGGIVSESDPELELAESVDKGVGLCVGLGLLR